MLVNGLFNVQGTATNPNGKRRSTRLPNGEYLWLNWFEGAQAHLDKTDSKGLYFPPGNYLFSIKETLSLREGQIIEGAGWESSIYRNHPRGELKPEDPLKPKGKKVWVWDIPKKDWGPMIRISNANNVCVRDIAFDSRGTSADGVHPIEVSGSSKDITLDNIRCINGHTAMWIKAGQNIRITDCECTGFLHNIYLGNQENTSFPPLQDVLIKNCILGDSKYRGSDGIKALGRCHNLVIDANVIRNCFKDALDLFASGDRLVISNNDLRDGGANGIDIKTDYRTYPEKWGNQGQNIVVIGNLIHGNDGYGVKIWAEYDVPQGEELRTPYNIVLMNNQLTENGYGGVACEAPYISIIGNLIAQNAAGFVKDEDGNYLPKIDKDGESIVYKKDKYKNYIYKYDEKGKPVMVNEKNALGDFVYRNKKGDPTKIKNGDAEFEKVDGKIVYLRDEDDNLVLDKDKNPIPLPKKVHDREYEPRPVEGHGILLQRPADVKRDPKDPKKVLRVDEGELLTGSITSNIIVNNGHPEISPPQSRLNYGIFCSKVSNTLISQNILGNDPNRPNPHQNRGILLARSQNIHITDNHFGTDNAGEQAIFKDEESTFTAVNNIGLENHTAPSHFTIAELQQMEKDLDTKDGELVSVIGLSNYLKRYLPPEKIQEYTNLAYYDGRDWLCLLTTGEKIPI